MRVERQQFALTRLAEIKPDDCVLAFTFPPYARTTHPMAMWAKGNKAKVIAVTSSAISALRRISDIVLLADSAGVGATNRMANGSSQCAA
jgi:DNA-binding MurR/RpiR family transcriptional regulator